MQAEQAISAHSVWRQICRLARSRISPALYRSCFTGTQGIALEGDGLVVAVPTVTVAQQMEQRFATLLRALAERVVRRPLCLRFMTDAQEADSQPAPSTAAEEAVSAGIDVATCSPTRDFAARQNRLSPELKPHYTFQTFIAGESNRLAFAAAQQIAAFPGQSYNPLFIYGGVGLGKTHLLMAIGHVALSQGLYVHYVTSETFTNEIVEAIQHNQQDAFRARYRAIDVLLVDDIQFIGGKEQTEEEFFHTFNALHNANKQIVVTSDRAPRAIPTLHDRLRSRFEWGLLADVTAPDYAHRLAILKAKVAQQGMAIPASVLEYMAQPEGSSVRQLEGALNRLVMTARMHGTPITLALAAATLRECFGDRGRIDVSPKVVMDLVANHYHIEAGEMLSKGRTRNIAWPRQVAMFLLREETGHSLAQIGAAMGGRDHTTIMHGCEQVAETMRHDEHVHREIETLRVALRAM